MKTIATKMLLAVAVAACAHDRPVPPPPPAPVAKAPIAKAPAVEAPTVVDRLVGRWVGKADTPFGPMPFAIEFVRESDGSVHGRAAQGPSAYLDFRFHRDGDRWLLTEEGKLPGVGVQRHTLAPAEPGRWVSDDPSYLAITVTVDGDAMQLAARLRGKDHAAFHLRRAGTVSSR